jgi:hypothetical protein
MNAGFMPDIGYIVTQATLVMGFGLFPFFALCLLFRSRLRCLLNCALTFAGASATLAAVIYLQNSADGVDLSPRVGPSLHSLTETLVPTFAWTIWVPTGTAVLTVIVLKSRVHGLLLKTDASGWILAGALVACFWVMFLCVLGEYTREDTIWAKQFASSKWKQVAVGMDRMVVYNLIGPPLEEAAGIRPFAFEEDGIAPELWAWSSRAGHYAAVWFTNDSVMTKRRWFAD